jgi:hypothetical protein
MQITFKDPDQVHEATQDFIQGLTQKLMEEKDLTPQGARAEAEARAKPFVAVISNFFEWGEYVHIELDSETKTARVIPRSEWKD